MSEMKHTPSPWVVDPCGDILGNRNTKDDNGLICAMCSDRKDEEGYANARLIAAAPDLLAVAHKVVNNWGDLHHKDLMQLRAAIAKAAGEAK